MEAALAAFDALLSPDRADRRAADRAARRRATTAFFAANGLLLRNPSIVNLLDGCALTLPCHAEGELPVGLMLWAAAHARRRRARRRARGRSGARPIRSDAPAATAR